MSPAPQKRGRIVLKGQAYRDLVNHCYARDGWKCRRCGSREHLTPHHLIKRSDCHIDADWNLVTLCIRCHNAVEAKQFIIIGNDANQLLRFRPNEEHHSKASG